MAASLFGLFHGVRAGLAQVLYCRAKFGPLRRHPPAVFRRLAAAHRLYPFNYRFCAFAAQKAYHSRDKGNEEWVDPPMSTARRWCDVGLALNHTDTPLRLLKVSLLEEQSAAKAAAFLEEYVDWDFWDPYYHAELVRLYARAGDFGKAARALSWVKGSKYYAPASAHMRAAWEREKALPK